MISTEDSSQCLFRAALISHSGRKHIWIVLGSGSWFENDPRDCWLTLHGWVNDGKILCRIEDPKNSPWKTHDVFDGRLLSRDEVLLQNGAKEWAMSRFDLLTLNHKDIVAYFVA
jgi:hypothetical protein